LPLILLAPKLDIPFPNAMKEGNILVSAPAYDHFGKIFLVIFVVKLGTFSDEILTE
jgi:hypothetical protein